MLKTSKYNAETKKRKWSPEIASKLGLSKQFAQYSEFIQYFWTVHKIIVFIFIQFASNYGWWRDAVFWLFCHVYINCTPCQHCISMEWGRTVLFWMHCWFVHLANHNSFHFLSHDANRKGWVLFDIRKL